MKETLQEDRVDVARSKEAMKKMAAKACHLIDVSHTRLAFFLKKT